MDELNDQFTIQASSEEDARNRLVLEYDIPATELICTSIESKNNAQATFHFTRKLTPLSEGDEHDLFQMLESTLTEIETDEFVQGYTADNPEFQELLQDTEQILSHNEHAKVQLSSGYNFPNSISYFVDDGGYDELDKIPFKQIETLSTLVKAGKFLCVREKSGSSRFFELDDESYQEKSHLKFEPKDDCLNIYTKIDGYPVIHKGRLFLIAAHRDAIIHLHEKSSDMECFADFIKPRGNGGIPDEKEVRKYLNKENIVFGIQIENIKQALQELHKGISSTAISVAKGDAPQPGTDSRIELFYEQKNQEEEFEVMADGRINYRKQANINKVEEGELLAKLSPPISGQDGMNVHGKLIPHRQGDAKVLYAGENVHSPDDKEFYATTAGRVSITGHIINVFKHFHVPGDVNMEVGNINFDGNVTVSGSIQPGFSIIAKGDIIIQGNIDRATKVESGRDLKVNGGIIGTESITIKCGRNLHASHLLNAGIEVEGDVEVKSSTVNSTVFCSGKFSAPSTEGKVSGGLIQSLRGIDIQMAGSYSGAPTKLVSGNDFLLQKRKKEFIRAQTFCLENIQKIQRFLTPLMQMLKKGNELPPERKTQIQQVLAKKKQLESNYEIFEARLKHLKKQRYNFTGASIKVRGTLHSDVLIKIRNLTKKINKDIPHCEFYENLDRGILACKFLHK